MAEPRAVTVDQALPDDMISFLQSIYGDCYRRGVRSPQSFLLLVAVLGF